jgi:uncharacterized protein YjiS (DUF1127 family)
MTCIAQPHSPALGSAWRTAFAAFGAALAASVQALLDAQNRARQHRQLAEMSPELLKDMGLTRGDVETELSRPFSPFR